MSPQYLLPPVLANKDGESRRAGFEFELGNLPVLQTADALRKALGGELDAKSPFEATLHGSSLGKIKIERDASILKSVKYRAWLEQLGLEFSPGTLAHEVEANIDNASKFLIPCEVVTEPIPFSALGKLNTLLGVFNELGAEGTQGSVFYAFGMHINAAVPAADADTLRHYLQAFLLLHTWIIEMSNIDITRRFFTKYIDPFPHAYMELVLTADYKPDIGAFSDDYLEHNPTRNRALDLLPVLHHLDAERVLAAVNPEERNLIKGRPAFHYRLPDCKPDDPNWSAAGDWNKWVYVEKLANDAPLLEELIEAWRVCNAEFSIAPKTSWVQSLTSLLSRKLFEA